MLLLAAASAGPSLWTVVSTIAAVVGGLATLAAVWFAWLASKESAAAARSALESLDVSRQIAQRSAETVDAARETVEVGKAAREADARDRQLRQLRDIAVLTEQVFEKAAAAAGHTRPAWRCAEQRHLAQALIGVEPALPKCHHLAGASQAPLVFGAARDARDEIAARLQDASG